MQGRKLFIGGLSPATDESRLKDYYSQWGEVTDAVVMKDYAGRSRGFGFVTFADARTADIACSNRPHEIDGKMVDTKPAIPKGESQAEPDVPVTKIFVGGLRRNMGDDELYQYFSTYGSVTEAIIMVDKETNQSRGFGFVTFSDTSSVDEVVSAGPHSISGFPVDVKKAVAKDDSRQPRSRNYNTGNYNNSRYNSSASHQQQWSHAPSNQSYNAPPPMGNYQAMDNFWTQPPPPAPPQQQQAFGQYSSQNYSGGPMRNASYQSRNGAPPYGR